jgi:hypothetical protein
MSLFEDLENFTNQLDQGKKPSKDALSTAQKKPVDLTYDVNSKLMNSSVP